MAEPLARPIFAFMILVLCCGALIAATAALTRDRIDGNRARHLRETLTDLTGSRALADRVRWSNDMAPLCDGTVLLRGVAAGYGGDIRWLMSVDVSGSTPTVSAIRIAAHQETPGIADFLDDPGRGWMASLEGADGRSLGTLDGVSGATITSRALARSLAAGLARPELLRAGCSP